MDTQKLLASLKTRKELELTVKGRKTGRDLPRPVWFVLRNNEVLLLPVTGTTSQWYKNILKNSRVKIEASGQAYAGNLQPITEKGKVSEVVDLFNKKYGAGDIKRYYPRLDAAVRLTVA